MCYLLFSLKEPCVHLCCRVHLCVSGRFKRFGSIYALRLDLCFSGFIYAFLVFYIFELVMFMLYILCLHLYVQNVFRTERGHHCRLSCLITNATRLAPAPSAHRNKHYSQIPPKTSARWCLISSCPKKLEIPLSFIVPLRFTLLYISVSMIDGFRYLFTHLKVFLIDCFSLK